MGASSTMVHALAVIAALQGTAPEIPAAPGDPVTLRWQAPASCPDATAVSAAIAARRPIDPVVVDARVSVEPSAVVADLAIDSAHGSTRRQLTSPSCESIVEAVALLVQVAADPLPTPARIAPPTIVAPAPATLPEPDEADAPDEIAARSPGPRPPAPTRGPVRARLSAAAIVGTGTLPVVDVGGRLLVGIASRHVHADVGASVLAPQRAATPSDTEVRIDAFAAVARVCPVLPVGLRKVEISACAVLTAGVLRGRSGGAAVADPGRALQPFVRLAAAPELAIAVHPRVRLTGTLEVGGRLVRAGFAIAGLGRVWTPRPWAIHGGLGVEVRLP